MVLLGRYNAQGLGEFAESAIKRTIVLAPPAVTTTTNNTHSEQQQGNHSNNIVIKSHLDKQEEEHDETLAEVAVTEVEAERRTNPLEVWIRIVSEKEYIKLIVYEGKVIGALLIGDTNLEEVFENLILNQLDVTDYGMDLLNPDYDLEDFFD